MKDDNNYVSRTSLTEFIGRPLLDSMNNTLSVGGQKFLKTLSNVLFSRIKFRHLFYFFNIINYCVYEHYLTENFQIFHILIQKIALNTLHIVLSPTA